MRLKDLLRMDVRDLPAPGGPGFCAALMLAAGLCVWLLIPGEYFGRPVPMRAYLDRDGFGLKTTVRGAEGTVWKAFDGNFSGDCFHSQQGATSGTLTITFPRPVAAGRLRLAPQNDLLARTPRDFSLEALEDDGRWSKLAEFSGIGPDRYAPGRFTDLPLPRGKARKTYRLSIKANNGDPYLTFSELALEERTGAGADKFRLFLLCCACLAALCGARRVQGRLEKRAQTAARLTAKHAFAAFALLPFTLLFLLPARVYLGNASEFESLFSGLFPAFLACACLIYGLLLAVFFRIPAAGRARALLVSLALAAGFLVWAQASFWPWTGGELNGGPLAWQLVGGEPQFEASPVRAYMQAVLWASGLGLAWLAPALLCRFAAILPAAVLGAQLAALGFAAPGLPRLREYKSACSNPENLFVFSSDGLNAVVIVLDMFQSDLFDEIIKSPGDRFARGLDGFTYFRNTVAGFPVTQGSVPELLTGEHFDNSRPLPEYLKNSFRSNSLPKAAAAGGLPVAMLSWTGAAYYIDRSIVPDARPCSDPAQLAQDLAQLYDLALFEAAPDFVKPRVYAQGRWLLARFAVEMPRAGEHGELRVDGTTKAGDIRFAGALAREGRAAPGPGAFKFLHLMGNHIPNDMDEALKARPMPFDRESSLRQARGALEILERVLGRMKELGVYDNSVIFVLGDHGSGLQVRPARGTGPGPSGWLARGVPLLLAKDAGASGRLKISDAPAELRDVPFTLAKRMGWAWDRKAEDLFAPKPGARVRRFTLANSLKDGKFGLFRNYEVSGHAWDGSAWRETGGRRERIK